MVHPTHRRGATRLYLRSIHAAASAPPPPPPPRSPLRRRGGPGGGGGAIAAASSGAGCEQLPPPYQPLARGWAGTPHPIPARAHDPKRCGSGRWPLPQRFGPCAGLRSIHAGVVGFAFKLCFVRRSRLCPCSGRLFSTSSIFHSTQVHSYNPITRSNPPATGKLEPAVPDPLPCVCGEQSESELRAEEGALQIPQCRQ